MVNGIVYDSVSHSFYKKDLHIQDATITNICDCAPTQAEHVVDAQGAYVLPGFVDLHTHLREPGGEHKETIRSGTLAGAKGGFTTLTAMANTQPPLDNIPGWEDMQARLERDALIQVLPVGAISTSLEGKAFSPLFQSSKTRIYSDDGKGIQDGKFFMDALKHAKAHQMLLILHEEDSSLAHEGVMHLGQVSMKAGLPGIPSSAESSMLARDLLICEKEHYSAHYTHLSARQSVALLEWARSMDIAYTADTTPHHLFFCDEDMDTGNADFKVNPPLRSDEDRKALIHAVVNGIIPCIGTDHAPHSPKEKQADFLRAPFGISGIETAFPALYTALVLPGYLSFEKLIPLISSIPASILGLKDCGKIQPGYKANLTFIRLEEKVFTLDSLLSKGKNSPFAGYRLTGWPEKTIFEGTMVYEASS